MRIVSYSKIVFFLTYIFLILFSASLFAQEKNIPFDQTETYNLMVGERLFHGLIPLGDRQPSCSSCHTKFNGDEINWNPSAMEMANSADTLSFDEFKSVVNSPKKGFVAKVHTYNIPDEQLKRLQLYLKHVVINGVGEKPVSKPRFTWFILLGVLMTLALIDLLFTKYLRYRAIHILIIVISVFVQMKMVYTDATRLGRNQGYRPDQPIKFSHKVHAGANQINCKYCHFNAEHGKSAGIPGTGLCMNCHLIVREGSRSGKSEIAKVVKYFDEGKEIEWIRIHNLPDYVFFNHAQHVNVGKLDCAQCHGKVEEMDIMKQENELSMGWCLRCHKKTNVQFTENRYYSIYQKYHKEIETGLRDSVKAVDIGANDCMMCHY